MGVTAAFKDSSIPPDSHLVMILAGHQVANPSTLKLSDVFTPLGVEIVEKAWNIQPVHHLNDTLARAPPPCDHPMQPNAVPAPAWS